jgi:hypothetical protein
MTSYKNIISIYDVIIVTSTFLYVLKNNHELTLGPSQPHLSECSEFFLCHPLDWAFTHWAANVKVKVGDVSGKHQSSEYRFWERFFK